ncbi:hypothetical protein LB535_06390 [Mesorhizobium sp. CA10]|nr:hypothetical protein [Mesorhizobium sp. CA10]
MSREIRDFVQGAGRQRQYDDVVAPGKANEFPGQSPSGRSVKMAAMSFDPRASVFPVHILSACGHSRGMTAAPVSFWNSLAVSTFQE